MVPQAGTPDIPEAVARAAYGIWVHNGHDTFSALAHVSRHHISPEIRQLAGEAHDLALRVRWLYETYEATFARMAAAERDAG